MNPYYLIFHNAMQTHILLSFRSENAWFAALYFGGYDMGQATLMACVGSILGLTLNYAVGYYISRWRDELPTYDEDRYLRISKLFRNKLFLLVLIPPLPIFEWIPGISFMPLLLLICGMFRVPPRRAILAITFSRFIYYGYYLMQPHGA